MYTSKLLEILQALDKTEVKRLSHFLRIPYFVKLKQRQKAIALLDYILIHREKGAPGALTKENVFQQIFPGELYASNKIDKLMARLLKAAKQFIVYQYSNLEEDENEQLLTLAKFYRKKELDKYFQRCIAQLKKNQRSFVQKDKEYFFRQYLIEQEITDQASLYNNRRDDLNLPNTLKSLDAFYLCTKLEYACWSLAQNISTPLEVEKSLDLLDLLLPQIEKDYLDHNPLVSLYYQAYQLLRKGMDREKLDRLQTLLEDCAQIIPREQLQALQAIYRSFIIRAFNQGEEEKTQEIFLLYKKQLEEGYLYQQGGIYPGMVRNIVTFGLKAHAYAWVEQFLKNHQHKIIGTKNPKEVYQFNLASYFFALKKYEETLKHLVGYEEDTYYKIAAKRLELQVYFETQSDLLETKMMAFKVYIYRVSKKILPPEPFKRNNNFINLLRQINSPQLFKNEKKIQKLITKIHDLGAVVEREWLLEKLMEKR